jgi:hypothetical protein
MRFINRGEPLKIRSGIMRDGYHWITLKTGETIDLPEQVGKAYCLERAEVLESKVGSKTVETKQFNNSDNIKKGGKDGERDG